MNTRAAGNQRGGAKINLVIGLLITAALIICGMRIVPVYINSYRLEDAARQKAKFAPHDRKSPETIREELYKEAQTLELPVSREQIQVVSTNAGVRILIRYKVPVDLVVTKIEIPFDFLADTTSAI